MKKEFPGRMRTLAGVCGLGILAAVLLILGVWENGLTAQAQGGSSGASGQIPLSASPAPGDPAEGPTDSPAPTPWPRYTTENYWIGYEQMEDPLLLLVNDHIPLPEGYEPEIVYYTWAPVNKLLYDSLVSMMEDAQEAGMSLWIGSCYRSVEEQKELLEGAIENRMLEQGMTEEEATANALQSFTRPGHSEHNTGLAIDFNDVSRDFKETKEYQWLQENAWKYGFVQRYPEDKTEITGIIEEVWHFRYVGVQHAARIHREGVCLEEYIIELLNAGE